jgi:acetylornithine/succinyldiaminopimelate/putrescine aminotransferase
LINEVLTHGFDDFRNFVNPLVAQRVGLSGEPARVVQTHQGKLVLDDGRMIEDFHGTQAFGHRHPKITQAVRELLDSDSANWFPSRVNPYSGRLARLLCERSGVYTNAFFASSGSEAVESGMKLARAVTRRPRILGLEKAYHGCTMGSCALMGESPYKELFAPHLQDAHSIPADDIERLAAELAKNDVAAVIVEPIQLEGGVRPLSDAYI